MKSIVISFFGILIFTTLVVISGCDLTSNQTRQIARERACYANMRVLRGCVEMYNMDQDEEHQMHRMFTKDYLASDGIFISGKYLRGPMTLYEDKCAYFERGDLAEDDSKICCDIHGTVD